MKPLEQQEKSLKDKSNLLPFIIAGGILFIVFIFIFIAKIDANASSSNNNYMSSKQSTKAAQEVTSEKVQSGSVIENMNAGQTQTLTATLDYILKTFPFIIALAFALPIINMLFGKRRWS